MIYITCLTKDKISLNYEDVTEKWLCEAKPNNHRVKELNRYVHNGISYTVDGKNVVLDYSAEEKEVAKWLPKTFGGKIYLCPRINIPEGISTLDYKTNNNYWDLKTIKGNGKNVIDNAVNGKRRQDPNFIIDISSSLIDDKEALCQAKRIFTLPHREWVNSIMIKRKEKVVVIYQRKKN